MLHGVFALVQDRLPRRWHRAVFALYPPLIGAGIVVEKVSDDLTSLDVRLMALPWTRNIHGTHFGGSIYAMTDAFYAYMLQVALGSAYVAWAKAANIKFRRPGRGTLRAQFRLPADVVETVKRQVDEKGRAEARFLVEVKDVAGEVVAQIEKIVTVKPRVVRR